MTHEEKRAWIMGVVSAVGFAVYAAVVLGRARGGAVVDVAYVWPMVATIGGAIVVSIVLEIAVSATAGRDGTRKDQRDREIGRFGEYVGHSFVVIGGVAALLMAMLELDHFWIANAVYLAFALSAVLSSAAKIVAYRRGFQPW